MKTLLITGAAGFIGRAACAHYKDQYHVIGVDDLSRPTAKRPDGVMFIEDDAVSATQFVGVDYVLHLAAQVSVVKSNENPYADFSRNAALTMRLARWAACAGVGKFIYASTNKVFGPLPGVSCPILDTQPLAPSTPYGISKATGGMYVREFLPDAGYVFHQSCIYGLDQIQHATWDQGWVGFLASRIARGEKITCYGDGTQQRDLLHIVDLLNAYDLALEGDLPAGAYVTGGGPENLLSFQDAVKLLGGEIAIYQDWRPSDQKYFCSANQGLLSYGWRPELRARDVLPQLVCLNPERGTPARA